MIGALRAGTEIFLSQFLFHVLILSMYGDGFSLVPAEGLAEASPVYGVLAAAQSGPQVPVEGTWASSLGWRLIRDLHLRAREKL